MGAKLNWTKVHEIRRRFRSGDQAEVLARDYGVKKQAILDVVHGISWRQWSPAADSRYVDMREVATNHSQVYTDWEGFTTRSKITRLYNKAFRGMTEEDPVVKTLIYHWIHEACEQAEEPATDEILTAWTAIQMVVNCRYFLKEDAKAVT